MRIVGKVTVGLVGLFLIYIALYTFWMMPLGQEFSYYIGYLGVNALIGFGGGFLIGKAIRKDKEIQG